MLQKDHQSSLKVIFEDNSLMVLDKPPGLVVDKSETQQTGTLEDILTTQYGIQLERGGIVHRLDKDTSGLIVVAKTEEALDNLQAQFKERGVKKRYLALVHGHLVESRKVEGAIGRNPGDREKFTVLDDGKEAVTEFRPLGNFKFSILNFQSIFKDLNKIQMRKLENMNYNQFTLVECLPQTGRTHQIRVHLKHIGFPIVGDSKYGGRKIVRLDHRWCPRQFLHAAELDFKDPVSGMQLHFESELPDDLQNIWNRLTPSSSNSP